MPTSEIFKQNLKSLKEINPLLALQFQMAPQGIKPPFHTHIPWEQVALETIELLYVYGWQKTAYAHLSSWLHQKKERRLVFLEDDRSVGQYFLEQESIQEMLQDPQVEWGFLGEFPEDTLKTFIWSHLYVATDFFALPTNDPAREEKAIGC